MEAHTVKQCAGVSQCKFCAMKPAASLARIREKNKLIFFSHPYYTHKHTPVQVQCNCGVYMRHSHTRTCTDVTQRSSCYHNESGVILCFSGLCIINCSGDKCWVFAILFGAISATEITHRNIFAPVVGFGFVMFVYVWGGVCRDAC